MTFQSNTAGTCTTQPRRRVSFLRHMGHILATRRQRLNLENLNATQLQDIGISRSQARTESKRRAWDVPDFWRA